ncbi:hypothetical protein WICANDRAFT_25162 [Wickerhamomyces anomalus NRRL Y-366-8]|uniref:NB-ARC domain-containing protein n=1 Tax=Wickerhamomyces anomalus (strain ATCC 58044 / CBS 1984 / NCYC 433 / NRRL Y-366-8) TaxID=683960 RepID=A0A1E3P8U6_WICAA|nr:uncharacterized protein WICANDRAFT_25162 [Wickerhamomyces anomalus NRRL Y-366-8]ODQ61730.1 hypothetical protein WICANDRAFT_25162 [Wickerhamomyces anomalus NRRL Y-366-8]
MDSTYTDLANRTLRLLERSNSYRILILLIGAPGSGKSTIAQRVIQKSTGVESSIDQFAQVVPMDGFHLPRRVLHQFKDSKTAIARRGSPFTFDSSLIVQLVENINETLQIKAEGIDALETAISDIPDIYIPSFNHAEHDPKQFGTVIHSSSRVLIMEGLYLLLNEPIDDVEVPNGKNYELWKIITDEDTMLYRVGKRHLNAGIVKTLKEGEDRVKFNDLPNGKLVYAKSFKSDLNIFSIDDENESVL